MTRSQAKQLGIKKYFSGKPCVRGHNSYRYTSKGSCVECLDNYRHENPEKFNENKIRSTTKHRQKRNAESKAWKIKNKDRHARTQKLWRERNNHLCNMYARKRQASIMRRTPDWVDTVAIAEIETTYLWCSSLRKIGVNVEVDHVVPLQGKLVSGLHVPENLQVIHMSDNRKKSNYHEL